MTDGDRPTLFPYWQYVRRAGGAGSSDIIRQLKAEGKGIVYISHKMDEIKEIGDVITVLKDGISVRRRFVSFEW